ncbi:hypothetical protein MLD38_003483 [Melastoma candidum]|uniref:Uncharacterized protein n=1 Tax=Melastoma candidum TaxID=119954 RepID=A0ACB9S5W6_9MYRT|nr:hypothetical protein MLD38_003483 [Melastoma candidum]
MRGDVQANDLQLPVIVLPMGNLERRPGSHLHIHRDHVHRLLDLLQVVRHGWQQPHARGGHGRVQPVQPAFVLKGSTGPNAMTWPSYSTIMSMVVYFTWTR